MDFNIEDISKVFALQMQQTGVWQPSCPLSMDRLKIVNVTHIDFQGHKKSGRIVVLDKLAESTLNIFYRLLAIEFPIHKICSIDEYLGNDNESMKANNSSCFNYRVISGTSKVSMHGYGAAIDINPLQNPCIEIKDNHKVEIHPLEGTDFLNRNNVREGMVESVVDIFQKNGFSEWGGNWNTPIDYHHFQVPRQKLLEELI